MVIFTPNTVISSTDVNGNFDELKIKTDYLSAPDSDWITPTFVNSWVNYDSTVFNPAGYRKDALGYVHLRGLIKNGTVNTTFFTLPTGYRPYRQELFMSLQNNAVGRVDIETDGDVKMGGVGSNAFVQLDGLIFKAYA